MQKGFNYLFEKTKQLPSEIAEIVLDFDFTGGFTQLVNKYKLHLDQADLLEDLTFRVMFGELDAVTYVSRLSSDLSLPSATAKELSEDANLQIVMPVKNAIIKHVEEEAEYYKDVELDESEMPKDEESVPSPQEFHPKSAYNEPITNDEPVVHHVAPIHETKLTHADVLHGIENPHPSISGNNPVKTASGAKSYADIMGSGSEKVKPAYPQAPAEHIVQEPIVEVKPKPAPVTPAPNLQQQIDLIAMKSSSVVVSAPNKIETLPTKPAENLPAITPDTKPVDPYKETI